MFLVFIRIYERSEGGTTVVRDAARVRRRTVVHMIAQEYFDKWEHWGFHLCAVPRAWAGGGAERGGGRGGRLGGACICSNSLGSFHN